MAEGTEDCNTILAKAAGCLGKMIIDHLPIILIVFVFIFMVVGVYQSSLSNIFGGSLGLSRGSGTRNQIEMFSKRGKKKKKL